MPSIHDSAIHRCDLLKSLYLRGLVAQSLRNEPTRECQPGCRQQQCAAGSSE